MQLQELPIAILFVRSLPCAGWRFQTSPRCSLGRNKTALESALSCPKVERTQSPSAECSRGWRTPQPDERGQRGCSCRSWAPCLEMGGEQRQAETPAHLLLPGPDRDSASDASTVWGLTGQVGSTSEASWVLTLACWALPRAFGAASSCGPASVVWALNRTLPRGQARRGTVLSGQRTSSPSQMSR